MLTRCPGCNTVHSLNATLLAQGNGLYRCASCNKVSNALQNLYDEWPSEEESPHDPTDDGRELPILGGSPELGPEPTSGLTEEEAAELHVPVFEAATPGGTLRGRKTWLMALAFVIGITVVNLVFISGPGLLAQPPVQKALQSIGLVDPIPPPQYRNLQLIHLASSEMHGHPTLENMLLLNATIVNRADRPQPFPALEVTLFDAHNQPLAGRIFEPREYLPPSIRPESVMSPGVYLPVLMEILDPDQLALGFEIKFH